MFEYKKGFPDIYGDIIIFLFTKNVVDLDRHLSTHDYLGKGSCKKLHVFVMHYSNQDMVVGKIDDLVFGKVDEQYYPRTLNDRKRQAMGFGLQNLTSPNIYNYCEHKFTFKELKNYCRSIVTDTTKGLKICFDAHGGCGADKIGMLDHAAPANVPDKKIMLDTLAQLINGLLFPCISPCIESPLLVFPIVIDLLMCRGTKNDDQLQKVSTAENLITKLSPKIRYVVAGRSTAYVHTRGVVVENGLVQPDQPSCCIDGKIFQRKVPNTNFAFLRCSECRTIIRLEQRVEYFNKARTFLYRIFEQYPEVMPILDSIFQNANGINQLSAYLQNFLHVTGLITEPQLRNEINKFPLCDTCQARYFSHANSQPPAAAATACVASCYSSSPPPAVPIPSAATAMPVFPLCTGEPDYCDTVGFVTDHIYGILDKYFKQYGKKVPRQQFFNFIKYKITAELLQNKYPPGRVICNNGSLKPKVFDDIKQIAVASITTAIAEYYNTHKSEFGFLGMYGSDFIKLMNKARIEISNLSPFNGHMGNYYQ
jgi:hypothetical protein